MENEKTRQIDEELSFMFIAKQIAHFRNDFVYLMASFMNLISERLLSY